MIIHDISWRVMIKHLVLSWKIPKSHQMSRNIFIPQVGVPNQMSSNVTMLNCQRYPKIFQFNMLTFGDMPWFHQTNSQRYNRWEMMRGDSLALFATRHLLRRGCSLATWRNILESTSISVQDAGKDLPGNMCMKSTWWLYMKDGDFIVTFVGKVTEKTKINLYKKKEHSC